MSHTISGRDYRDLRFNGVSVGETGINAALCGTWGCPVVLVTGDDVACREARRPARAGARHRRGQAGPRPLQRAPAPARPRPRAHRGGRQGGGREARPDSALRPRQAVRDRRRPRHPGPRGALPPPPRRRARRPGHRRLPRRGLVDRLAPVLLLGHVPGGHVRGQAQAVSVLDVSGRAVRCSASTPVRVGPFHRARSADGHAPRCQALGRGLRGVRLLDPDAEAVRSAPSRSLVGDARGSARP